MASGKKTWQIGDILIAFGVILVGLILSPIWVPLVVYALLRDVFKERRFRRFLQRNNGAKFFCYTSKPTGLNFARQKILPRLAKDVKIIYMSQRGRDNLGDVSPINTRIGQNAGGGKRGGYPCVAKVVSGELISESLNTEFYRTIVTNAGVEKLLEN